MIEVAILRTGQSFGELALIANKPRAATIRCMSDTHFAVLSKQDYDKVLGKIEYSALSKMVDFLKVVPIFKHWSRTDLSKLTYYMTKQQYKRH